MKKIKKIMALVLAMAMMLAMNVAVFAQSVDTGAGGRGTIKITNAAKSQTYSIFKLFDATVSAGGDISYKLMSGKTNLGGGDTWFSVDSAGNVLAVSGADVSSDAFATWAQSYGVQVGGTETATDSTVSFTNVPYGYYYIKSSLGTTLTVDSTNPTATVVDKNTTSPNIPADGGKKIVTTTTENGTTTTALTNSNTAAIGDTVNYQITFNATNFETNNKVTTAITEYVVEDTPTALDINSSTVVVKVGNTTLASSKYTVSKDDNGKLTITIPWQTDNEDGTYTALYDSPSLVTITYSATVTGEATDNATNAAKVKYNDKELDGGTTTTETYYFDIVKDNDKDEVLTGAEFKLYDALTGGNEIPVVKIDDGVYRVAEANETGVAIEAGQARIKGLDGTKTYYLEETTAPVGYNILTSRVAVAINNSDNTATVENDQDVTKYVSGGVEIVNQRGAELPSTGGIGTTIFYVIGAILVIGAGIVLVTRRRMYHNS